MSVYYCPSFADGKVKTARCDMPQNAKLGLTVARHLKWVLLVHYEFLHCHSAIHCPLKEKKICKSNCIVQSKKTLNIILIILRIYWPWLDFGNLLGHKHTIIICSIVVRFNLFAIIHFHRSNWTLRTLAYKITLYRETKTI